MNGKVVPLNPDQTKQSNEQAVENKVPYDDSIETKLELNKVILEKQLREENELREDNEEEIQEDKKPDGPKLKAYEIVCMKC